MNIEGYDFETDEDGLIYLFVSHSDEKEITKVVAYIPLSEKRYNLGFGDLINLQVSDTEISNNGDGAKVLATVIKTMFLFFEKYPAYSVVIEGSTPRRTRIYNWLLDRYLEQLLDRFTIYGLKDGVVEVFEKHNKYSSFEIKLKKK